MSAPLYLEVTEINKLSFGIGSSKQEESSSGCNSSFWHGPSCQHKFKWHLLAPAKDPHHVGTRSIAQAFHLPGEPRKSHIYENVPPEPLSKASVSIAVVNTRGPSSYSSRTSRHLCLEQEPQGLGCVPSAEKCALSSQDAHAALRPHQRDIYHTLLLTSGDSLEITHSVINQESNFPGYDHQPVEHRA